MMERPLGFKKGWGYSNNWELLRPLFISRPVFFYLKYDKEMGTSQGKGHILKILKVCSQYFGW